MKVLVGFFFVMVLFGIIELMIYGVMFKLKWLFYCVVVGGVFGGVIIGVVGMYVSLFIFFSLLVVLIFLGYGFMGEVIGLIVVFLGGVILMYFFGFVC